MKTTACRCHFCKAAIVRKDDGRLHFCDNKCKGDWQRTKKPVTREWLVEHYIGKQLDTTKIGHMVNRDPKSVWNWLKDFGIQTRPRGAATSKSGFKKGAPNPFTGRKHSAETRQRLRAIALADGRVPYDPKVGSYMKGRKGADCPNWKGGITAERQQVYSSKAWKAAANKVWKRDAATCQRCGRKRNDDRTVAFDIHHKKGFEHKPTRCEVSNLILLCEPCHYWVHSNNNTTGEFICL